MYLTFKGNLNVINLFVASFLFIRDSGGKPDLGSVLKVDIHNKEKQKPLPQEMRIKKEKHQQHHVFYSMMLLAGRMTRWKL